MLIHNFLLKSAEKYPHNICLIHENSTFTYNDVLCRSLNTANALHSLGIRKGDRVGILLKNCVEYATSYYGTLMAGAITVPINTGCSSIDLSKIISTSGLKIIFTEECFHDLFEVVSDPLTVISNVPVDDTTAFRERILFEEFTSSQNPTAYPVSIFSDDIASIIFTSGSTGTPKGVTLSHRNIFSNTMSIVEYLGLSSLDRIMVILPFFYVYGKSLLNTHFAVGGSVILDNRFVFPNLVLDTMYRENATGFAGVPSTFTMLLARSSVMKYNFPSLRYITQAGGSLAPSVINQLVEVFPDKDIFIMYGATEATARLTYLHPSMLHKKMGSVGKAIPGVKIEVKHADGTPAKPGEVGEVIAFGDNIMKAYWNAPEATANALKGGALYTGDLGYFDNDSFLYLNGRKDDIMKVGGHKVSPVEIENVLFEIPEIFDAAVIPVNDELLGQVPYSFIVAKNETPISEEKVLDHCRRRLPPHKIPKYFEFAKSIPKGPTGKIMKKCLKPLI